MYSNPKYLNNENNINCNDPNNIQLNSDNNCKVNNETGFNYYGNTLQKVFIAAIQGQFSDVDVRSICIF